MERAFVKLCGDVGDGDVELGVIFISIEVEDSVSEDGGAESRAGGFVDGGEDIAAKRFKDS